MIYLDHAATTPADTAVVQAMLPYFTEHYGNPSSLYGLAGRAFQAIAEARRSVADVLNAQPNEIVFTSGGTEAINAAIRGTAIAQRQAGMGNHIVTTLVEHHAVLHTCQYLEHIGFDVTYLPVDREGYVTAGSVGEAVTEQTVLVAIMLANNEVGTLMPVAEIAAELRRRSASLGRQIALFTDAVAAAGYVPLDVQTLDVDLLAVSSHKFGGPKGSGLLFIRRGTPFVSQLTGGGQERQRRAGTENVPGIVGTATALRLAEERRPAAADHTRRLRDTLRDRLLAIPDTLLNGSPDLRLANNLNVSFADVEGERLLLELDHAGIAASSGSACASSTWEPSHVLMAMGVPPAFAAGSLRLTLGYANTDDDVDYAARTIAKLVERLRCRSALDSRDV